jgi:hypothetical protein
MARLQRFRCSASELGRTSWVSLRNSYPEMGFEEIMIDVPEPDFWFVSEDSRLNEQMSVAVKKLNRT